LAACELACLLACTASFVLARHLKCSSLFRWACSSLKSWLRYDDALNVFGIHGVGGLVGSGLLAVFANPAFGGNQAGQVLATQAVVQAFSACAVMLWSMVGTFVVVKVASLLLGGVRVSEDVEAAGCDLELAEPNAYMAA
jgi:ammonium transporter, Amt family